MASPLNIELVGIQCQNCKGTGIKQPIMDGQFKPCKKCNGTGFIKIEKVKENGNTPIYEVGENDKT